MTLSVGECDETATEAILDHFFDQGGNFIDTANNYQFEESEERIGAWMKKRNNRDQMVIATKYTTNYQAVHGTPKAKILVNFNGNGSKSLHTSVEASLKKLQTDYIDLVSSSPVLQVGPNLTLHCSSTCTGGTFPSPSQS